MLLTLSSKIIELHSCYKLVNGAVAIIKGQASP